MIHDGMLKTKGLCVKRFRATNPPADVHVLASLPLDRNVKSSSRSSLVAQRDTRKEPRVISIKYSSLVPFAIICLIPALVDSTHYGLSRCDGTFDLTAPLHFVARIKSKAA
jgi:hypothetical protein